MELVTGNPSTLKTTSAAGGTFSLAGSAAAGCAGELSGVETAPLEGMLEAGVEDDCAFTFTAKIAAKNAQTRKILANRFTKIISDCKQYTGRNSFDLQGRRSCRIAKNFTSTF
jgi:hypothetical protein